MHDSEAVNYAKQAALICGNANSKGQRTSVQSCSNPLPAV